MNDIGSRLKRVYRWMNSTPFDLVLFEPLVTLILNHSTDLEVWNSFIKLFDTQYAILKAEDEVEKSKIPHALSIYRFIPRLREF